MAYNGESKFSILMSKKRNKMKDKIIEILMSETFNTSDEAGNSYIVISSEDFEDIADRIVKLFAMPDISNNEAWVLSDGVAVCDELYHNHVCLSSIRYMYCPHCGEALKQTDC